MEGACRWDFPEERVGPRSLSSCAGFADAMPRNFVAETAYIHFEKTIDMLNKSMDLCLPVH